MRTDTYDDEQWQLVPKKVTETMVQNAEWTGVSNYHGNASWDEFDFGKVWEAMLAAAPTPPASAQSVEPVPPILTDEEIEEIVKRFGARWNGNAWVIEDADLHPLVRGLLYRYTDRPAAPAQSVEPVAFPREVLAWFNSYKSFVDATDAYNARLAVICARREEFGEFGSADPEYRAMNAAQCEMLRHLPLMFSALCRTTAPPSAADVRDSALEEAAQEIERTPGRLLSADAIRALKSKKEA